MVMIKEKRNPVSKHREKKPRRRGRKLFGEHGALLSAKGHPRSATAQLRQRHDCENIIPPRVSFSFVAVVAFGFPVRSPAGMSDG